MPAQLPIKDRILRNVKTDANGCWRWQMRVSKTGYGQIWITTSFQHGTNAGAHRESHKAFKGEIPEGYHIDHLCKVRDCVNPDHLEAVTPKENVRRSDGLPKQEARRTHCPQKHEYSRENTHVRRTATGTARLCKACDYARKKVARLAKRELAYAA